MNRTRTLLAVGIAAAVALLAPAASVSAQTETQVRIVHGLNLAGQSGQDEGGTPVTICLDGLSADPQLEFGQVLGPVPFPTDSPLEVVVIAGADRDCDVEPDDPEDLLIVDLIELEGADNTWILSYDVEEDAVVFGVLTDELITECTPPGTGAIAVGNAAATAGPLELVVEGFENETIEFLDEFIYLGIPAGTNGVGVEPLFAEPLEIDLAAQQLVAAYIVGGIPGFDEAEPEELSPYVAVYVGSDLEACEEPTPPPTTAPAPPPAPTPTPAPAPAPRANTGERPLALAG